MQNSLYAVDANRSTGSYALVKVFLWAILILGFIGTVQGLALVVGNLSWEDTNPEALKQAIKGLTGGLGMAFDTTLLGLILSMFISFLLALIQKQDEKALTMIDVFSSEKLLPKLNEESSRPDDSSVSLSSISRRK
jgi:hypothetical protein